LGDVPSAENTAPSGVVPTAPLAARSSGSKRGLLDEIPDALDQPSHLEVPKVEMSTSSTEAIAKEYERELRQKLAVSSAKKTFLQAHGAKLFITLGVLVVIGGSVGSYLFTRSRNMGLDLGGAIAKGRSTNNADSFTQYPSAWTQRTPTCTR
jgi:hypothetical protein